MKKTFVIILFFMCSCFYGQTAENYIKSGRKKCDLNDDKGAIEDYTKAIKLNPKSAVAYNDRGNSQFELKNYRAALADYTKAIELDPNYGGYYNNRGNSKSQLKDYNGACLDWHKAVELGIKDAKEEIKKHCK